MLRIAYAHLDIRIEGQHGTTEGKDFYSELDSIVDLNKGSIPYVIQSVTIIFVLYIQRTKNATKPSSWCQGIVSKTWNNQTSMKYMLEEKTDQKENNNRKKAAFFLFSFQLFEVSRPTLSFTFQFFTRKTKLYHYYLGLTSTY